MTYTTSISVDGSFEDVVETTTDALAAEGFGVLCDIDVQATLKEKLGEEFRDYRILGACNPEFAHQAMEEELELGALLPCNVIVYADDDGGVVVSAVAPDKLLSVVENDALDPVADEVDERLQSALATVEAAY
ncbi:DUF302 domain-containing protein [Halobellus rubicundus]|uniref:DUF302 domain-containing protein n=1 Tax=Halobellus rubicundus TaxID=2996466 RepID=A0ABD5MBK5_9EURY